MARCRIGYLLALAAAGGFFLSFDGWLSFYIVVLALVFPLFSLLVSLPGMLGCRVRLVLPGESVRRGQAAEMELRVESRWSLPVARLRAELSWENRMTGERRRIRRVCFGAAKGCAIQERLHTGHCGRVVCRARKVRVCDLLGLFSLHLPAPAEAEMMVLPLELPSEPVAHLLGEEKNLQMKPRPGGGPGEDYELRGYRPGDPLRSVHWKLSAKADDLVVRETLEPVQAAVVLTFDLFGMPELLDRTMDRLDAVSRALTERERPHYILWCDPTGGEAHQRLIRSVQDLRACQWEAFALRAPLTGHSVQAGSLHIEGMGDEIRRLHVLPEEGEA